MNKKLIADLSAPPFVLAGFCLAAWLICILGWLHVHHAAALSVLAILLLGLQRTHIAILEVGLWCAIFILGLGIALYRPAGFSYPNWINLTALHEQGKPFAYYPNLAKGLAGFMVLTCFWQTQKPNKQCALRTSMVFIAVGIAVIIATAIPLLGLEFHPKLGSFVVLFLLGNLLFTCVAEEAFMRLLLQQQLQNLCKPLPFLFLRAAIPLTAVTLLFVITHALPSVNYWLVFGFAGFSYAFIYWLTGRVSAAIALHFGVNAVHFLFLTYPL